MSRPTTFSHFGHFEAEKIGLLQETHSAQAQKCRVGEGGLSDILGLDAVNVGGAETHVHTMQYIWND